MNLFSKFFKPGLPQLEPAQVKAQLSGKERPLLLDVRQPEEFREGHIPGARLIPLRDLPGRMNDLPRNREIVCVCRSGSRSASAARHLADAGYRVSNLRGGMIAWTRSGLDVKRGS